MNGIENPNEAPVAVFDAIWLIPSFPTFPATARLPPITTGVKLVVGKAI